MGTRILVVRHGRTVAGSEGRYTGHGDSPLTEDGRSGVLRAIPRFRRHAPSALVSSDLGRCLETARLLAPCQEPMAAPALRELSFGEWEGKTFEEIRAEWPTLLADWLRDPVSVRPPGGETLEELRSRVVAFAVGFVEASREGTVAFVTHEGPIRVLIDPTLWRFWSIRCPCAGMRLVDPSHLLEVRP